MSSALDRRSFLKAGGALVVGFSLGGNLTLKYTGEAAAHLPAALRAAVGISVPCDLSASSERMAQPDNAFYLRRFLRDLADDGLKARSVFFASLAYRLARIADHLEGDGPVGAGDLQIIGANELDRKSTRLNSSPT